MAQSLTRSSFVVSTMTLLSRFLGLARDIVIAQLVGAGVAADVFFFANRIPNFLRRLFAEGAFNQAFVPVIAEYQHQNDRQALRSFLAAVNGTLGILVAVVVALGVLGSGVVTALFGLGWFLDWLKGGPAAMKFELASFLLKITFPYLWFITLTAMAGSILNTLGKFAIPAITPTFLNITLIGSAWYVSPHLAQPEIALAIGVLIGGVVQLLFQIPFLAREGLLVWPRWDWTHPGVIKIRKLMLPALFGVSVSQINLLVDTLLASFLATGAISYLYYADRLLEFPLALFGIAFATVILPALSHHHQQHAHPLFSQTVDWGVKMVLLLGMPAMCGLMLLAQPILRILFLRGAFDMSSVQQASASLIAYSLGLVSLMLIKILAPAYYARQDTKTPVKFGVMSMIANIILNLLLIGPLDYVGLALATSLSGTVNAYLLYHGLRAQGIYQLSTETLWFIVRVLFATGGMAAILFWFMPDTTYWFSASFFEALLKLTQLIGLSVVVYTIALFICGFKFNQLQLNAGKEADF